MQCLLQLRRFELLGPYRLDRAGTADGFLLDTYPGLSLRLITREPHLGFAANLPTGVWTHVAATIDGETGRQVLYCGGNPVAGP